MTNSERRMVPVMHQVGLPHVEIEAPLLDPDKEFHIGINPQVVAQLLVAQDHPVETVDDYTIAVRAHSDENERKTGSYDPSTGILDVYVESALRPFHKAKEAIDAHKNEGKIVTQDDFRDLLFTRRLPAYLNSDSVPTERADKFANSLLKRSLRRHFRQTIIHETNHIAVMEGINHGVLFRGLLDELSLRMHNFRNRFRTTTLDTESRTNPLEIKAMLAERSGRLNNVADGAVVVSQSE